MQWEDIPQVHGQIINTNQKKKQYFLRLRTPWRCVSTKMRLLLFSIITLRTHFNTMGTRGFFLACDGEIRFVGRRPTRVWWRPKTSFCAGFRNQEPITAETGIRAWKASGTQGNTWQALPINTSVFSLVGQGQFRITHYIFPHSRSSILHPWSPILLFQ